MNNGQGNIYNNIHDHDYLGFTTDHQTNYRKVVDFLELDQNAISKLTGVSKKSIRYDNKIPVAVKDRLEEIANICLLVAENFNGDVAKTALWFKATNPLLGNISPRDMIRFNRYHKLLQFILDAREDSRVEQKEKEIESA